MKTQLPPELVEKIHKVLKESDDVIYYDQISNKWIANECAQIAVEYADEQYAKELYRFMKLRKQRDELLEALREIIRLKDESQISWMMSNIEESKKLINKIDGE